MNKNVEFTAIVKKTDDKAIHKKPDHMFFYFNKGEKIYRDFLDCADIMIVRNL